MYDTRFFKCDTDKMLRFQNWANLHYEQKYNFSDKLF